MQASKSINDKLFQTSDLNSIFTGTNFVFEDYIIEMRNIIARTRLDLNQNNAQSIITANTPFQLLPTHTRETKGKVRKFKNGILLIHGLTASPYSVKDMGAYFQRKGFLVRAILLPGHGTVPGDLLKVRHQEWIKAVNYGIESLVQVVDNIYIAGHSLGGTLAIYHSLLNPKIKALILSAPALKPRNLFAFATDWHKIISWLFQSTKWLIRHKPISFAQYQSLPFNALHEARLLMRKVYYELIMRKMDTSTFIVATSDDETISTNAIMKCFTNLTNKKNKLLLYSNNTYFPDSNRVIIRTSAFPQQKILDLSHPSLHISPENPHYGKQGDYKDFLHYGDPPYHFTKDEVYLGAILNKNLKSHIIQRLSYNPDFHNMLNTLDDFLESI